MTEFDHDPEEIVRLGAHDLTLRTAVRRVMALSPRPQLVDIFRELGKEPPVLGWDEIEWLASLPDYAASGSPA